MKFPIVLLFAFGASLLVGGAVWLNTTRRCRSMLGRAPWRRVTADIETRRRRRSVRSWVSWGADRRLVLTGNPFPAGDEGTRSIEIVERGRHAVICLPETQQLRSAIVPRKWSRSGK